MLVIRLAKVRAGPFPVSFVYLPGECLFYKFHGINCLPNNPAVARVRTKERTEWHAGQQVRYRVKFGRKRKLSDYQRAEAVKRRNAGETLATIAKSYGVDISMISRL
jgi:hypothetical protein